MCVCMYIYVYVYLNPEPGSVCDNCQVGLLYHILYHIVNSVGH